MARLWGALQSTITEAYKTANDLAQAKWKEITCTVIDEGETTERRLLDVNVMGDILEAFKDANGLVPGMVGYVGPTVQQTTLKQATGDLTSTDLDENDDYTFDPTVNAVWLVNDGAGEITLTIDTLTFTIKQGESRVIEPGTAIGAVSFSATPTFRMNGLNRK